ncbi:MAG: GRP family sugar transporter [Terriglobia bacterium]
MFIPQIYSVALLMMVLSMLCWGSWANTQKLTKDWRFELFYWDYVWGILLCAVVIGLTFGRTDAASPDSFFPNLSAADSTHLAYAFVGGIVFNIANILIVAAIAIAGLAVAFPVGIGLALVVGSVLNYIITPKGNPLMLFGGIALVCVAIVLDALAYRKISSDVKVSKKGILISLLGGFGMGLFYPFVAKAISGENHLGPYTVAFVFTLGIIASTIPVNYIFMRRPVSGTPVAMSDYLKGTGALHFWGVLGGMIWAVGTISNFVASYAQMVGPAISYSLGQGATMVAAIWGVFVWKEFKGAGAETKRLLALMFIFFIVGLTCVALAPVV